MALPLPPGLTPPEIAFLCEMELVTIIPRQRLEGLKLLGGPTPPLTPPHRTNLPLWLALLLKRQKRANIAPPPWLSPSSLGEILDLETGLSTFSPPPNLSFKPLSSTSTSTPTPISPPFTPSSTASAPSDALPYHWLELGEILLEAAADDFDDPDAVRRLLRDLRDARMAKVRAMVEKLEAGGGVRIAGVGGMEVAEGRAFLGGVVDGLRKIEARREKEEDGGGSGDDDMDDL
ncbi:GINS complex, PSF2 component [Patellaria atrata CBS 101060]|uniref:DNA replication complex GINS protein PSF2 n=1 Tax=Patellaria atrata CBS 101060 TaxID=1346257 RepID=A0A9P4VT80_9PEZI|nr:GINS complex, PSF2 component [Patellaria atrata CBS 101060]